MIINTIIAISITHIIIYTLTHTHIHTYTHTHTHTHIHVHTVKAGGMRVVTKHKPHEKPDPDAYDQKYIDQLPEQQ